MATRVHRLNVNGEEQEVLAPAHWTLLEVLRYKLRLTGTKQAATRATAEHARCSQTGPHPQLLYVGRDGRGTKDSTIEDMEMTVPRAFDVCGALMRLLPARHDLHRQGPARQGAEPIGRPDS